MAKAKALFDSVLSYFISKKLLVFILASVFLVLSLIGESSWLIIAAIYIGSQAAIDAVAAVVAKAPISQQTRPQGQGGKPAGDGEDQGDDQEYS